MVQLESVFLEDAKMAGLVRSGCGCKIKVKFLILVKVYSKKGRNDFEKQCFYVNDWTPVL